MGFLVFVGIISLIFGLLLLISPQAIRILNEKVSKGLVNFDEKVYNLRIGAGVSLILISFLAFFVVYFLIKKGS